MQGLYRAALLVRSDEDEILVDEDRWAQAEELRRALGLPLDAALLDLDLDGEPVWLHSPAVLLVRQHPRDGLRRARLLACDCAERVLPLIGAIRPEDARPQQAIVVARAGAEGRLLGAWRSLDVLVDDIAARSLVARHAGSAQEYQERAAVAAIWSARGACMPDPAAAVQEALRWAARAAELAPAAPPTGLEERRWQQRRLLWYALAPEAG